MLQRCDLHGSGRLRVARREHLRVVLVVVDERNVVALEQRRQPCNASTPDLTSVLVNRARVRRTLLRRSNFSCVFLNEDRCLDARRELVVRHVLLLVRRSVETGTAKEFFTGPTIHVYM